MRASLPPTQCRYFSHDEMRNVWSQVTYDSGAGDQSGECHQANKKISAEGLGTFLSFPRIIDSSSQQLSICKHLSSD